MQRCANCRERKPIVFKHIYHTLDKKCYQIRLCADCCSLLMHQLFDYTIGCEYDKMVTRYGVEVNKDATCVQDDGESNAKAIRKKERRKNSKHEVEQRTQRNRSNSRKRKKVKC